MINEDRGFFFKSVLLVLSVFISDPKFKSIQANINRKGIHNHKLISIKKILPGFQIHIPLESIWFKPQSYIVLFWNQKFSRY